MKTDEDRERNGLSPGEWLLSAATTLAGGVLFEVLSDPAKRVGPGVLAALFRLASFPLPAWSVALAMASMAGYLISSRAADRRASSAADWGDLVPSRPFRSRVDERGDLGTATDSLARPEVAAPGPEVTP
jgi:hypothetical protein